MQANHSDTSVDSATFRHVLGHYPTGVCVVTAVEPDVGPVAMVVGSFTSVSLDPPLVAFFPARASGSWPHIEKSGRFRVNIFGSHQEALCRQFARPGQEKFGGRTYQLSKHGNPVIDDVVAWIECTLDAVHEAGDHHIVLGRVIELDIESPEAPLLFFRGSYGGFSPLEIEPM